MAQSVNGRALHQVLGHRVVVRYNDGYFVNPDRSNTRELPAHVEQAIIDSLAFEPGARFPKVVDDALLESGAVFTFEGF